MVESYAHAPYHYLPPSYRDGDTPLVTVVSSSGGVLGGDVLDASFEVGRGARLALRTQAATKLYRTESGPARSRVRFHLDADAQVDYFPDELIPFADSDYEQVTDIELGPGACLWMSEIVTAGRLERSERFAFSRLCLEVRCHADGHLRLWDRGDLRPRMQDLRGAAILGDATVWGTLYVLTTRPLPRSLADAAHCAVAERNEVRGSASLGPIGLVARVLGASVESVRGAIARVRAALWPHLWWEGTNE